MPQIYGKFPNKNHNMLKINQLCVSFALGTLLLTGTILPSFGTEARQFLHSHVPAAVAKLSAAGLLPATNRLHLAIGLPLRNSAALNTFLRQVYDPASPGFRQYLTPEQFTEQFGPSEQDYQKVIAFAQANGLTVTAMHGNRVLLDVSGAVAEIERAFHVTLRLYQHPHENRRFFAPDVEPSVDLNVLLADVSGLNDYALPHPKIIAVSSLPVAANGTPKVGSGAGGTYVGTDFRNAYAPGTTLNGAGQMVGLLQFDGFYSNDIVAYENLLPGAPRVTLQTVLLDGFNGVPTSAGNIEVSLDIEMAIAMAPGLSKIIVFEGNPASGYFIPNDVLNNMAASNMVKNLSCSWGWSGGPNATTENIFLQMAAQGQSFFNASGDSAALTLGQVDNSSFTGFPSSSPNITQVGGTTLTMNGAGASYASETVWNSGGGSGSSGGISSFYPLPGWQQGISMTANHGSTVNRNIPDVALTGDNVHVRYNNGSSGAVGGTSVAAPLWAGFMALVNQQAAAAGNPPAGFINPAIYALGKSLNYSLYFNDITTGNNFWSSSPTNFPATTGYDLCTGWGTPTGTNLINALATPNPLTISPLTGFNAFGPFGGPFNISSQSILVTNITSSPINWVLGSSATWLTVLPMAGTVAGLGKTNINVTLAAVANTFAAGIYSANIFITNLTVGIIQTIPFTLQIGQSIAQNGGFENGNFSNWTLIGSGTVGGSIYNGVVSAGSFSGNSGTNFIHTGTYGAFLGDSPQIGTISQTLTTVPGQGYLLSFWLANPMSGSVQQFLVNWNTNSPAINQIYYLTNPPVLPWTNITFVVTATGTNSSLQFGAQNDPQGFGLDDVSVKPIPLPSITAFTKTNNVVNFSWNSLAGVAYQLEFSTNLLSPNWMSFGSVVYATNSIATTANLLGSDPQRFYRIRRLP